MIPGGEIESLHMPFIDFLRDKGLHYINPDPTRKSTIQKGHPDFTVLLSQNRNVLIEFKLKGKSLSADQKKRIGSLAFAGIYTHVCTDLATAKTAVLEAMSGYHREVVAPQPSGRELFNGYREVRPGVYEKVRTA